MNQSQVVSIPEVESLLMKALEKLRKTQNHSEQISGLGLVNRASKLAKAYASQVAEAKAKERFERMQAHKLKRLQQQSQGV